MQAAEKEAKFEERKKKPGARQAAGKHPGAKQAAGKQPGKQKQFVKGGQLQAKQAVSPPKPEVQFILRPCT